MFDKSKVYGAYVAWIFFVVTSFMFPKKTDGSFLLKKGLEVFAYVKYSPLTMLIFCVGVGGALFLTGLRHDDVNKIWTLLFGVVVLISTIYTILTSGWI